MTIVDTFGENTAAQTALENGIRAVLGSTVYASQACGAAVARIKSKFKRWKFNFEYDTDDEGESDARFQDEVESVAWRWKNVADVAAIYDEIGKATDGKFSETWSGSDHKKTTRNPVTVSRKFTDNITRGTKTLYSGVGSTGSDALADYIEEGPVSGQNTTEDSTETTYDGTDDEETQKGTSREYSDGRTPAARLADALAARAPWDLFVCSFAVIFVAPRDEAEPCTVGRW